MATLDKKNIQALNEEELNQVTGGAETLDPKKFAKIK